MKALLSLLRAGLWERPVDDLASFPLTSVGWSQLLRMAAAQTVTGLIYRGIHHLPSELMPPDAVLMRLVAEAETIARRNDRMNAALGSLADTMAGAGLAPVLMKGQGIAALYHYPVLRQCGDIDLWFPTKADERAATDLMRRHGCEPVREPDGGHLYTWQGVAVEHHTALFDVADPFVARTLRRIETEFPPVAAAGIPMRVPSPEACLLLLSAHILKHIVGMGIGLRQFCDMARACHVYAPAVDRRRMAQIFADTGLMRWQRQLNAFLVHYMGLDPAELPVDAIDAEVSPRLTAIVFEGGNFGRGNDSPGAGTGKRRTALAFWHHRRFSARYAPREALWTFLRLVAGNLRH